MAEGRQDCFQELIEACFLFVEVVGAAPGIGTILKGVGEDLNPAAGLGQ